MFSVIIFRDGIDKAKFEANISMHERILLDTALLIGADFAQAFKQGMEREREIINLALQQQNQRSGKETPIKLLEI